MSGRILSDADVKREGLEALIDRLGPLDAVRFLEQFAPGSGDYTKDRKQWLDKIGIEELVRGIQQRRKSA